MIGTREDFAQINATLADAVPDEHEELLDLIEALREVARAARKFRWNHIHDDIDVDKLEEAFVALPDWITE